MVREQAALDHAIREQKDLATYNPVSKLGTFVQNVTVARMKAEMIPVAQHLTAMRRQMSEMQAEHDADREADRKQTLALVREMTELKNALTKKGFI
jgi:hypothetical protein